MGADKFGKGWDKPETAGCRHSRKAPGWQDKAANAGYSHPPVNTPENRKHFPKLHRKNNETMVYFCQIPFTNPPYRAIIVT